MKHDKRKMFAVFATLSLLLAGGAMAATQGVLDTAESDTTTVNYMTDGETIDSTFNASADDTYALPVNNSSTADLSVNVSVNGTDYYEFTGTWNEQADSTGDDYIHNITGADLARVPMDINENVTLNVTWWETGNASNSTSITVYLNNTDERTVSEVTTSAAFVTVENASAPFYKAWQSDYEVTSVDESVKVNGSNTSVIYTLASSDVSEDYANMTEATDTGTFLFMQADLGSTNVPMFYKAAPEWYDASTYGSYAVYDPNTNMVTYTLAGDKSDATKVNPQFTNDVYRVNDVMTVFSLAGGWDNPRQAGGTIVNMVM